MHVDVQSRHGRYVNFGSFSGVEQFKAWLGTLPFNNGDAVNDLVKGVGLGKAGQWRGVPAALADQVVEAKDRAGDTEAGSALFRGLTVDLSPIAEHIGNEQRFGLFGRGDEKDARYMNAMREFVRRLERYTIEEAQVARGSTSKTLFIGGGGGGGGPGGGIPTMYLIGGSVGSLLLLALLVRRKRKKAAQVERS